MRVIPDQCTAHEVAVMLTADDAERMIHWADSFSLLEEHEFDEEDHQLRALMLGVAVYNKLISDPERRIADALADDFVQSVSRS